MGCTSIPIVRGETFEYVLRWETKPFVYKAISTITKAAPVAIGVTGHGLPDGWFAAVVSAQGMREINSAVNAAGEPETMHQVTVVDENNITINDVNAAAFHTYTGGGYLQYYTPHDLTDYTARAQIKDQIGGSELVLLTTENDGIVIDVDAKTVTLVIDATDTAAIDWDEGVIDVELVSPAGKVYKLLPPTPVIVDPEVTTVA